MTLLEKHGKCIADLVLELREAKEEWWRMRLVQKLADMKEATIRLVRG